MERDESPTEPTTPGPVAQRFTAPSLQDFLALLKADGLLLVPFSPTTLRAVTHLDVSRDQIEQAGDILKKIFKKLAA